MPVEVLIRADASVDLGSGHVFRCMTLAEGLRHYGASVTFACATAPGDLTGMLAGRGYRVLALEPHTATCRTDAQERDARATLQAVGDARPDWVVVDHYLLDSRWEGIVRGRCGRMLAIDDLADRVHDCDVLLDQNADLGWGSRYRGLVPDGCLLVVGSRFALLREQFEAARSGMRERDGRIRRILVFYGASDPANQTAVALEALGRIDRTGIAVDVIAPPANPHAAEIARVCAGLEGVEFHSAIDDMAGEMARCDLALGAAGTSSWERCYLGVPAIVSAIAENQVWVAEALSLAGAALWTGTAPDADDMERALRDLLGDPERVRAMSESAVSLMEGAAPGHRHPLVSIMTGRAVADRRDVRLRAVVPADSARLLEWRNSERVRTQSLDSHVISAEEHRAWFDGLRGDMDRAYYIFERCGIAAGVVYFTGCGEPPGNCTWGFYLGEPDLPEGTGTVMCFLGLATGFDDLGMESVDAEVLASNQRSVELHERLGFHRTGSSDGPMTRGVAGSLRLRVTREQWASLRPVLDAVLFTSEGRGRHT